MSDRAARVREARVLLGDGRSRASGREQPTDVRSAREPDESTVAGPARSSPDHAPPGWTTNPSAWRERLPIVALSLVGVGIATYLTLFQLELIDTVWEPFFGDGSRVILTSSVSTILPIPDAALGAIGYLLDAVTGLIGGPERWRRMPWMVVLFGLAVGPLGGASVLLVILQPVLFDSFCTLCLASAVVSVAMIGPAMDEVLASLQLLRRVRDRGDSVWRAFWSGADA